LLGRFQGCDLNLLTGGDLINVGNNLSLLAQDGIRNAMAGEIRGKQVSPPPSETTSPTRPPPSRCVTASACAPSPTSATPI